MSLGAPKVSSVAASGIAASASAQLFSGGKGSASQTQAPVEAANYSSQAGVNDNNIVQNNSQRGYDGNGQNRQNSSRDTETLFMSRQAVSFAALMLDETPADGTSATFSDVLARGMMGYARSQMLVNSGLAPLGSTINQLT